MFGVNGMSVFGFTLSALHAGRKAISVDESKQFKGGMIMFDENEMAVFGVMLSALHAGRKAISEIEIKNALVERNRKNSRDFLDEDDLEEAFDSITSHLLKMNFIYQSEAGFYDLVVDLYSLREYLLQNSATSKETADKVKIQLSEIMDSSWEIFYDKEDKTGELENEEEEEEIEEDDDHPAPPSFDDLDKEEDELDELLKDIDEKENKESEGMNDAEVYEVWFLRAPKKCTIETYQIFCNVTGVTTSEAAKIFREQEPYLMNEDCSESEANDIIEEVKRVGIFATAISTEDYYEEFEYEENDKEDFEDVCMNVIERTVSRDNKQTRRDAIAIAEIILDHAKENCTDKTIAVWERVKKEFGIATDEEYRMLREVIFDE